MGRFQSGCGHTGGVRGLDHETAKEREGTKRLEHENTKGSEDAKREEREERAPYAKSPANAPFDHPLEAQDSI
jgi:hypothetical protein